MKLMVRHVLNGLAGRYHAGLLVDDYSKHKASPNNDMLFTRRHEGKTRKRQANDL